MCTWCHKDWIILGDIPADAEKPNDKRTKSGKYIKRGDING